MKIGMEKELDLFGRSNVLDRFRRVDGDTDEGVRSAKSAASSQQMEVIKLKVRIKVFDVTDPVQAQELEQIHTDSMQTGPAKIIINRESSFDKMGRYLVALTWVEKT